MTHNISIKPNYDENFIFMTVSCDSNNEHIHVWMTPAEVDRLVAELEYAVDALERNVNV